jgi:hypothetical protein
MQARATGLLVGWDALGGMDDRRGRCPLSKWPGPAVVSDLRHVGCCDSTRPVKLKLLAAQVAADFLTLAGSENFPPPSAFDKLIRPHPSDQRRCRQRRCRIPMLQWSQYPREKRTRRFTLEPKLVLLPWRGVAQLREYLPR